MIRRAAWIGLVVLAGCTKPATEIVTLVRSDLPLASVRIGGEESGATVFESCNCVGGAGCPSLPLSLGIIPSGDDRRPFRVRADGFAGAGCMQTPLVTQSATVQFVDQETLALYLDLDAVCKGVVCPQDQTCRDGTCVDDLVPSLPQYSLAQPDLAYSAMPDLAASVDQSSQSADGPAAAFGVLGKLPEDVTKLVLADVDGDGRVDFIVGRQSTGAISVSINNQGLPGAPSNYGTSGPVDGLVAGDLDEDGHLDLVACTGSPLLNLFRNNGNGTFAPGGGVPLLGGNCDDLVAGHVDGDSHLDLVAASLGAQPPGAFLGLGKGDGSFNALANVLVGTQLRQLALADVDGDQATDLLAASGSGGGVAILFGKGDGTFGLSSGVALGGNVNAMAVGDLSGSGSIDVLAVTDALPGLVLVDGDFRNGMVTRTNFPDPDQPSAIAVADFDRNGRLDFAVADFATGNVRLYLAIGNNGAFAAPIIQAAVGQPAAIAAGDVDGDGKDDLVVGGATLAVLRNQL